MTFPIPVLNYIQAFTVGERDLAYLLVNNQGLITQWGGKLENYGIKNLQQGDCLEEKVFFLEGILPIDNSPIFLPCVKTECGVAADIHIFSSDVGNWILFLDASQEESQHWLSQQINNELSLVSQRQIKFLKQSLVNREKRSNHLNFKSLEYQNKTVLSANIRDYIAYIDKYPPDTIFSTFNLYLLTLTNLILEHGGLVSNIFGDTAIALFGILPSTSSLSKRAIEAALSMINAVQKLGKAQQANNLPVLSIGIGIASGSLIISTNNYQKSQKFNILGYPVYVAAILKDQACSGEILIDENTFHRIDRLQKHFSLSSSEINDTTKPIKVYSCLPHHD
ncbi:adenylate/guanylate cyclase domain-containing protein [Chroococcidiopsis sp. TS-821]|uniref:adenylate/guanylate cyclase domain-containing protein n=1 Tax=Chroococcidiopsis sp. TS-821 TaxID=1378066 RepID=UPI000D47FC67|nr:adenylate/guanylate cyclase domain-containing protein [Chroococcidiopsis sp. TS-821]PPS39172.1 hypothetical protein B1A85_22525 [Chroococcidiopsis sp. TS-821]